MMNLIIGAGEVGSHLAKIIGEQRDDVIIIDSDPDKLQDVASRLDVGTIQGHGADFKILNQLDWKKVRMVIAVTDSSEVNILVCFYAKQLGKPRTIARVRDSAYLSQGRVRHRDKLGVDVTVNPDTLCVYRLAELIETPGSILVENFARGKITVLAVPVRQDCSLTGKPLMEIEMPRSMLVAGIERSDALFVPRGSDSIECGDKVYVVTSRDHIPDVERIFGNQEHRTRMVVIYGGSRVGVLLARALDNKGVKTMIIDENEELCRQLATKCATTDIICGDPTDVQLLEEENILSADVFYGVHDNDHKNLVAALMAKQLGVKKCGVITHHFGPSFLDRINVDVSVSPKYLMANTILRFIRRGEIVADASIANDRGEIMELVVTQRCKLLNQQLKDVNLPRGILIGALQRGEEVIIPRGDDSIQHGDHVVVFTTSDMVPKVERIFFG